MNKKRYISPETVIIDVMDEEILANSDGKYINMSDGNDDDNGRYVQEERGSSIWD